MSKSVQDSLLKLIGKSLIAAAIIGGNLWMGGILSQSLFWEFYTGFWVIYLAVE